MLNRKFLFTVIVMLPASTYSSYVEDAAIIKKMYDTKMQSQEYQNFTDDLNEIVESHEATLSANNEFYKDYYGEENLAVDFNEMKDAQHQFSAQELGPQQGPTNTISQLMVFVSSSMPKESLNQYAVQVREAGGVMVLRGFVDGSMTNTVSFIKDLSQKGTRAIIDPNAFRLFDVRTVPQILAISDTNKCVNGKCEQTPLHDKIKGNISLEYALEKISKEGGFAQKEAQRFLINLRES